MSVHRKVLGEGDLARYREAVLGALRFEAERGFSVWRDSPAPVMLVWSPRILEFLEVLERVMSYPPARGFCREVGFGSGREGALQSRGAADGPEARIATLLEMPGVLAGAGWGVSDLAYDDEAGAIHWRFPHGTAVGAAAAEREARTNPACAFFEGFGAGWVQGSLGTTVEFVETACQGLRAPDCRFESQPL